MKKLCEYFILEKKPGHALFDSLTWVMNCGILLNMFTWARASVKFALCELSYRSSVFHLCVYTAFSLPAHTHTDTHKIWICLLVSENLTLIIVFDIRYFFFEKDALSPPQAGFPPVSLEAKGVLSSLIWRDFYFQSKSQYLKQFGWVILRQTIPLTTHMRHAGRTGSGYSCRSSLAIICGVHISSVWEDACVVMPILFDRFGSFAYFWGNEIRQGLRVHHLSSFQPGLSAHLRQQWMR